MQLPPTPPPHTVAEALSRMALRLGARALAFDVVAAVPEAPPALSGVIGRACVVSFLPPGITASNVAAHFKAYQLARDAPGGAVSMLQLAAHNKEKGGAAAPPAALLRFQTPLDAMTAARDMHRAVIGGSRIDVRLVH